MEFEGDENEFRKGWVEDGDWNIPNGELLLVPALPMEALNVARSRSDMLRWNPLSACSGRICPPA